MFVSYTAGVYWGAMGVTVGFLAGTLVLTYPAVAIPFHYLETSVWSLVRSLAPVALATLVGAGVAVGARVILESRDARPLVVTVIGLLLGFALYLGTLALLRPPLLDDVRLFIATRFRRKPPAPVMATEEIS
jgi:ethanolamine transporter EutH